MKFSHEVPVPLSLGAIRLNEWLYNLSEQDYKTCAEGHRAIGTNGGRRFEGMVNFESMAGALIIQHYRTEVLEAHHVRLFSEKSRAYLMHVIPFHLQVTWEIRVTNVSADESLLQCEIDVKNPAWVRFVGLFNATNYWIHKHLIEETHGFANDLTRKSMGP